MKKQITFLALTSCMLLSVGCNSNSKVESTGNIDTASNITKEKHGSEVDSFVLKNKDSIRIINTFNPATDNEIIYYLEVKESKTKDELLNIANELKVSAEKDFNNCDRYIVQFFAPGESAIPLWLPNELDYKADNLVVFDKTNKEVVDTSKLYDLYLDHIPSKDDFNIAGMYFGINIQQQDLSEDEKFDKLLKSIKPLQLTIEKEELNDIIKRVNTYFSSRTDKYNEFLKTYNI